VYPHLTNAPISEAVLDIIVEPEDELSLERLEIFGKQVRANFPDQGQIKTIEATFSEDSTIGAPLRRDEVNGYIYWNKDKTRAVQARRNGFAINHVRAQYTQWTDLKTEAVDLWNQYVAQIRPKSISRCALRYINRIDVSISANVGDILRTRIEVAPALPQQINGYFLKVQLPFLNDRHAIITQAAQENLQDASKMILILDIDTFARKSLPVMGASLWEEFEALRSIKNKCFFESLQPNVWEGYR